jgi:hypothetical protein
MDLRAPSAEATLGTLSRRVGRYLREDRLSPIVTDAQRQLIVLRSKFASQASGPIPSARRAAMDQANAELNTVIDQLDQFIAKFLMLTKYIKAGTGLGARTLKRMDAWLAAGKWRDNPKEAQDCWQVSATEFQASPEYREWRGLHDSLGETSQRLITAFPLIRPK